MGYVENANMVRVDFFRESGKWYTTEAVEFPSDHYEKHPYAAFEHALRAHFKKYPGDVPSDKGFRLQGMWAVCLTPYVEHEYPLMLKVPER